MHLDAERLELPCHDVGRAVLVEPELRMGMEVLALRGQLGVIGFDVLDRFHDVSAVWRFFRDVTIHCSGKAAPRQGAREADQGIMRQVVPRIGIEPTTPSLRMMCSTN